MPAEIQFCITEKNKYILKYTKTDKEFNFIIL